MTAPPQISLAPITSGNLAAVFDLEVAEDQAQFVAPNPWSLAQALVEREIAWPRAIVVDNQVVGFLMLEIDPNEKDGRPYWLWRLMVGKDHQRRGFGAAALALAIDEVRRRGGTELYTSWVEGPGGPGSFYQRLGFVATGEMDDDEFVARLAL